MSIWGKIIEPVANLFTRALDIVDDIVPDKDLANKLKHELSLQINNIASNEFVILLESQASIIITEIKGKWLAANWRPITMLAFVVIIINNYIIYPYLVLFFAEAPMLEIPPDMWSLLKIGLGGYVVGRSIEKIADGDGVKGVLKNIVK